MLEGGEQKREVVIQLSPAAAVEGKVTGEEGEPLSGCSVSLMRYLHLSTGVGGGERRMVARGNATTNDLGEYRVFDLPPGRYYVRTHCRTPQAASQEVYQDLFHPGVPALEGAAQLRLAAGAEVTGIDFRMRRIKAVTIEGKLSIPAVANLRPEMFHVQLTGKAAGAEEMFRSGGQVMPAGEFRIVGVTPGEYTISARSGFGDRQYYGETDIIVGEKPPSAVSLAAHPLPSIAGTVRFEGTPPPNREHLRVWLQPSVKGGCAGAEPGRIAADGAFVLKNVQPGECFVQLSGYSGYVKSVRLAGEPAQGLRVKVRPGSVGPLEIAASSLTGELEGSVSGTSAGALMLLLAPKDGQGQLRLHTGEAGRPFRFSNLPPGEYRLFAFSGVQSVEGSSPELFKQLESRAAAVKIDEGGRASAQMEAIPASVVLEAIEKIE
ncbi:MAG: carboxypeptidase-like regulatory domain-containing protein, partial [Bryobacteraceae bacterium]|nr:carboxypeptidase-like regulatory domain-containing protein [Bryobacteraceae bacterium]